MADNQTPASTPPANQAPQPAPEPPSGAPSIKNQNSKIQNPPEPPPTRKGKVARLPKVVRDRLNWMMLDSVPYRVIIEKLGPHGKALTENCLSTWKTGGHQDFLKELRLLDEYRVRHELTLDLARENPGIDVFHSAQKIAASLIAEAVAEVGAASLRQAIQANPLNLLRMLNSLSRVTAASLKCERHLSDQAERAARLKQQKFPRAKKGLSKAALKEMNDKLHLM